MEASIILGLLVFFSQSSVWAASLSTIRSPLRPAWCLIAVAINVACFIVYDHLGEELIGKQTTRAVLGTAWISNAWGSFQKLLVTKWNLEAGGPDEYRAYRSETKSPDLSRYTSDLLNNPRGIGRPWQVKGVPQFSSHDPKYVPSRRKFLARRVLSCMCCYLTVDLCAQPVPKSPKLYALEYIPMLNRVDSLSVDLLFFRMTSTIIFWLKSACGLIMVHDFIAFAAVAIQLSEPKNWPPLFGSPTELYTIRNFWG